MKVSELKIEISKQTDISEKLQIIYKWMYEEKIELQAGIQGATFIVRIIKARTCRNCIFSDYRTGTCNICSLQKYNKKYDMQDFEHPKNRMKYIPVGYCPKITSRNDDDKYFYTLKALNRFLEIFNIEMPYCTERELLIGKTKQNKTRE